MKRQHTTVRSDDLLPVEDPSTMRAEKLDEHDRPFAQYGHKGKNLLNKPVMFVCVFRPNSFRS